jgi:hypothetical protein
VNRFAIAWGYPPRLDGRRAFRGKPQLSRRDQKILDAAQRHGVVASHENGGTVFVCNGSKLPRQAFLRLVQLQYLVPDDSGLFGDDPQVYLVNGTR